MPAPLKVSLTSKEDSLLLRLTEDSIVPSRTRARATALRLSGRGWTVKQIAEYLQWHPQTVRETIHRWQRGKWVSLWDEERNGRPKRWSASDIEYIEEKLATEQRSYSSSHLCELLKKYRQVLLGRARVRGLLKQRNYLWKRTRQSQKNKQNSAKKSRKQADFEMLKIAAACGEMRIKYLDESGFSGWSNVTYTWAKRGIQKSIAQTKRRPRRISIIGVFEPGVSFEYGLAVGGIKSATFLKMMEAQAKSAALWWQETGEITVIVLDNYSIHKSRDVKARMTAWQQQHLYLFYLPEYCCEWSRIEDEWHQIKEHEIAGRMFEDEYDLAMAVITAIQDRSYKNGYSSARLRFQSA